MKRLPGSKLASCGADWLDWSWTMMLVIHSAMQQLCRYHADWKGRDFANSRLFRLPGPL